jgi:hypothetical protein
LCIDADHLKRWKRAKVPLPISVFWLNRPKRRAELSALKLAIPPFPLSCIGVNKTEPENFKVLFNRLRDGLRDPDGESQSQPKAKTPMSYNLKGNGCPEFLAEFLAKAKANPKPRHPCPTT